MTEHRDDEACVECVSVTTVTSHTESHHDFDAVKLARLATELNNKELS